MRGDNGNVNHFEIRRLSSYFQCASSGIEQRGWGKDHYSAFTDTFDISCGCPPSYELPLPSSSLLPRVRVKHIYSANIWAGSIALSK